MAGMAGGLSHTLSQNVPVMTYEGTACGRLDVLGGVADYSGAMVLEWPLDCRTTVRIAPRKDGLWRFVSAAHRAVELELTWTGKESLAACGEGLRREIGAQAGWTLYPAGCVLAFAEATGWKLPPGAEVGVESNVPEGAGVSSSAALEIAVVRALSAWSGLEIPSRRVASIGQRAEHAVVGAPCGLMDQLTVAEGVPGKLLPILCRPDKVQRSLSLPPELGVMGWMSGVRHSVGASPYARARAAAFMGKRWIEQETGKTFAWTSQIPLSETGRLPESIRGDEFLACFGGVDDPLSQIDLKMAYPVRGATRFPIEEHARALQAQTWLSGPRPTGESIGCQLGALLEASHQGYSAMGLGSAATDKMAGLAREIRGLYGARISGGGSGGTMVVLMRRDAEERIREALPLAGGWVM